MNRTLKDISESSRATAENTAQANAKLDDLKESSRATAENTAQVNEKLDVIQEVTVRSSKSKIALISLIVAVIALVVTVSGYSVAGIYDRWKAGAKPVSKAEAVPEPKAEEETETETAAEAETAAQDPAYEIYLYSEYHTVKMYTETEMTATLNFDTDAVSITAYYESGGEDTIALERKNAAEWQNKVYFDKDGVHKVVATAVAPNGETIENSIEVEVIPISMDIDMDMVGQFLPEGLQEGN